MSNGTGYLALTILFVALSAVDSRGQCNGSANGPSLVSTTSSSCPDTWSLKKTWQSNGQSQCNDAGFNRGVQNASQSVTMDARGACYLSEPYCPYTEGEPTVEVTPSSGMVTSVSWQNGLLIEGGCW
jgi:hypothetical protein